MRWSKLTECQQLLKAVLWACCHDSGWLFNHLLGELWILALHITWEYGIWYSGALEETCLDIQLLSVSINWLNLPRRWNLFTVYTQRSGLRCYLCLFWNSCAPAKHPNHLVRKISVVAQCQAPGHGAIRQEAPGSCRQGVYILGVSKTLNVIYLQLWKMLEGESVVRPMGEPTL